MHWYTDADREAMREAKRLAEEYWRREYEYDRRIYAWATSRGVILTPELERRLREILDGKE